MVYNTLMNKVLIIILWCILAVVAILGITAYNIWAWSYVAHWFVHGYLINYFPAVATLTPNSIKILLLSTGFVIGVLGLWKLQSLDNGEAFNVVGNLITVLILPWCCMFWVWIMAYMFQL